MQLGAEFPPKLGLLRMTPECMVRYYGFDHLVSVSFPPDTQNKARGYAASLSPAKTR